MPTPSVIQIAANSFVYPAGHPEGPGDGSLFVYVVRDESGTYLIDTGIGNANASIDEYYQPTPFDLLDSLRKHDVEPEDIEAVVCSHLHFDHCGNNRLFPGVPIYVQRSELEAARGEAYTVAEWIDFPGAAYRELDGSFPLTPHIEILSTPGHTPGHQSIVVDSEAGREIVVAQAAYTAAEFGAFGAGGSRDVRDDPWSKVEYERSLRRLHALNPVRAYFSHDETVWRREDRA